MLSSMTGFGRGSASTDGFDVVVEVRSVNSRFAEISTRLPRTLNRFESEIQSMVRVRLERGRINVQVDIDRADDAEPELTLDLRLAESYTRLLSELRDAAGIQAPLELRDLLDLPDILTRRQDDEDVAERQWNAVKPALEDALDAIVAMRRQEGEALKVELAQRLDAIERELEAVERRAPMRVEDVRRRLEDRLAEIMGDKRVDPDRLEQEIALAADRLDITEECVRLHSHLTMFREAMDEGEAVGRRLNFISQEINREVNTIGSKANDPDLARHVVVMKEELEKVREQIQNVE